MLKKISEASYISINSTVQKIQQQLVYVEKPENFKIFVATDNQAFLDCMKQTFGNRVCYLEMERSTDDQPIHTQRKLNGYVKGEEALLDCLILSKSAFLFRTASNLNNASLMFNPSLPSFPLNEDLRLWKKETAGTKL